MAVGVSGAQFRPFDISNVVAGSAGGGTDNIYMGNIGGFIPDIARQTAQAAPRTTTQRSTSNQQQRKRATTKTKSQTETLQNALQSISRQNMSDTALAALEAIITGRDTDPLVAAKDIAALSNIDWLQNMLNQLGAEDAETRASGRTADLARQLREQVLPEIFGGSELAGTGAGGNALAMLLAQDAAIRTGEAQSRVIEETRDTTTQRALQTAQLLREATQGTSAASERMLEALGISKGAVETGQIATTERGTSRTTETQTETERGTQTGEATAETTDVDPLAWAQLQAELALARQNQPNRNAQALAAFMAAGGDPARLTHTPRDFGASQYYNQLLSNIRGLI